MKTLRCILLAALALLPSARAWVGDQNTSGQWLRWSLVTLHPQVGTNMVNPVTRAVRFYIAADAYSAANTNAEYNAVRASFAQWQAVPGTHLKFEDAGFVPAGWRANTSDGTNIVYWAKTFGTNDNIGGLLGVCFFSYYSDNSISGADVVLNAVERNWTADMNAAGVNDAYFIESVLTHELGHFIGLLHPPIGGATMLSYGDYLSQAGLASDDISGVQALYPVATNIAGLGHLQGTVTKSGNPVLGAVVAVEDAQGRVVAATLSRANGSYQLPCVPPGAYGVRVTPLDPAAGDYLVSTPELGEEYAASDLNFLPTTNLPVTLTAGVTNQANVVVTAAVPPFYITYIQDPSGSAGPFPLQLYAGQSNALIGAFSDSLPNSGLMLRITGGDISYGAATSYPKGGSPFPGLPQVAGINLRVSIASNAAPGMRSLVVTRTNDGARAIATGFVEILPAVPDWNFDGLDDRFQRQYFPLFTAPEAGPNADPDGDGHNNAAEYIASTAPTNAVSLLKLESVTQTQSGTTIRWRSVSGKRYQVFGRSQVTGSPWVALGSPVTAAGATAQFFDAGAAGALKFYRVQVLP